MTRKDYIRIADALITAIDLSPEHCVESEREAHKCGVMFAAECIAEELERDNSRFNKEHFFAVVRGEKPLQARPVPRIITGDAAEKGCAK
jgi:hypothetical protein